MLIADLRQAVGACTDKLKTNKFLQMSSYMGIEMIDSDMYLTATDGNIQISSRCHNDYHADKVSFCVSRALFCNTVKSLPKNADEIVLKTDDNSLTIEGSSYRYRIPYVKDDNGLVCYPHLERPSPSEMSTFNAPAFAQEYSMASKLVAAPGKPNPIFEQVFFNDVGAWATDGIHASVFGRQEVQPFEGREIMMYPSFGDIIASRMFFTDYKYADGKLTLVSDDVVITGGVEDASKYPVASLQEFFNAADNADAFEVERQAFQDAVSRCGAYAKGGGQLLNKPIKISMNNNEIVITDRNEGCMERIPVTHEVPGSPQEGWFSVQRLDALMKTLSCERVALSFGMPNMLTIRDVDLFNDSVLLCAMRAPDEAVGGQ